MLNQVLYTRCFPHRDLRKSGAVERSEGFGVYTVSADLFKDEPTVNYDHMTRRLALKNGAKERSAVGLFSSYDYQEYGPGRFGLSHEFPRATDAPAADNQINFSGVYVKQCLVGELQGYPYEWFGSDIWDAHLKPQSHYYLDKRSTQEPPYLSKMDNKPRNGSITVDAIRRFVSDGRKDAVKAAVWFLIQEYGKPETERRVLLIKDSPENVALWVAAIERAFSPQMAVKVPFATNITRLGAQTDQMLFSPKDAQGQFVLSGDLSQGRCPYFMIAGFHPADPFCTSVRTVTSKSYDVIDGTQKTHTIEADPAVYQDAYYKAVVEYGEDIADFTTVVLPNLFVTEIIPDIPKLYKAFKYLLDSGHRASMWEYNATVEHLSLMIQYGIGKCAALTEYVLKEGISAYERMATTDADNGLKLLQMLVSLAAKTPQKSAVVALIMDRLQVILSGLKRPGCSLPAFWSTFRSLEPKSIVREVVTNIMNETELAVYRSALDGAAPEVVYTMADIFLTMLDLERVSYGTIVNNENQRKFVLVCILQLCYGDDTDYLNKLLSRLSSAEQLLGMYIKNITAYLQSHSQTHFVKWVEVLIQNGSCNIKEMCRIMAESDKISGAAIEDLLVKMVRRGKANMESVIEGAYMVARNRPGETNFGVQIVSDWIILLGLEGYERIARSVSESPLHPVVQKQIFKAMDEKIPIDSTDAKVRGLNVVMMQWGDALGVQSVRVLIKDLNRNIRNAKRQDAVSDALVAFISNNITLSPRAYKSKTFGDIVENVAEYSSGKLHFLMMCLFVHHQERLPDLEKYLESYISAVLAGCRGRHIVEGMLTLTEALFRTERIPMRNTAALEDVRETAEKLMYRYFAPYAKRSNIEQVMKTDPMQFSSDARKKLREILDKAESANKSGGLFGWAKSLFGKNQ